MRIPVWHRPMIIASAAGLTALLLALAAAPAFAQEPAQAPTEAGAAPEPVAAGEKNIVREWLESRPELEKDETACVMCAGFGGAVVCGLGCDATGLTIRKPNGYENSWCGRCTKGEWVK